MGSPMEISMVRLTEILKQMEIVKDSPMDSPKEIQKD